MQYQDETMAAWHALPHGTVNQRAHANGLTAGEPIIVMMDSLIRYAKAYEFRFESKLASDGKLGVEWLKAATAVRALLNGDGAIAMFRGITTDTKDNGAVERMFWDAMKIAGFNEKDMQ